MKELVEISTIHKDELETIDITQKKVKQTIPKQRRNEVWVKYMGEVFKAKCFCCKNKI